MWHDCWRSFAAAQEDSINVPLVVRLEGTNVDKGRAILSESELNIISADSLGDAAKKVVSHIKDNISSVYNCG